MSTSTAASPSTLDLETPVAFVFSGGTSLGAVQVGMLQALDEVGVYPDLLVGTSVGAINAAFVGGGFSTERVQELADIWRELTTRAVFGGFGAGLFGRLLLRRTLASPHTLIGLLEEYLPESHADLQVSTTVVAADALTSQPVPLSTGDLRSNVLASAAIPGVFPPVTVNGRLMVDGGIAANVPVMQASALGARTLVVLDAGYPCGLREPPRGLVAIWLHTVSALLRHQASAVLPFLAKERTVIYLPAPCPLDVSPHDFSRSAELIESGYQAASSFVQQLEVRGPGIVGHPHVHDGGTKS